MLNTRDVSRAGAKLRVLDAKDITTLKDHVLPTQFLQCRVLHGVFLGKNAFSGLDPSPSPASRAHRTHWEPSPRMDDVCTSTIANAEREIIGRNISRGYVLGLSETHGAAATR